MTEILTESFCERCGTRYTFESAAPRRARLRKVRTLSKGMKNFVLSDDSSFSEAMAEARSEQELAAVAHQLDAFHQTFNFCLTCRQYTCGDCWNEPEGRCLTCAPLPGMVEPGAAPFETAAVFDPDAVSANGSGEPVEAWPETDLSAARLSRALGLDEAELAATAEAGDRDELLELAAPVDAAATNGASTNGAGPHDLAAAATVAGLVPGQSVEDAVAEYEARLAADEADGIAAADTIEHEAPTADVAAIAAIAADDAVVAQDVAIEPAADPWLDEVQLPAEPVADEPEVAVVAAASAAGVEAEPVAHEPIEAAVLEAEAVAAEPIDAPAVDTDTVEAEAIDAAAVDVDAEPVRADADADSVADGIADPVVLAAASQTDAAASQPVVAASAEADETQSEAVVEAAEPQADDTDPLRATLAAAALAGGTGDDHRSAGEDLGWDDELAAEPAPEDAASGASEPVAAETPRDDVIAQPVWSQPAAEPEAVPAPVTEPAPAAPAPWLTVAPEDGDQPQWPAAPAWSTSARLRETAATLAGRPLLPQADPSGLWAASAREVLTGAAQAPLQQAAAAPAPTAQPCVSCGLSLSANARFCRRCGTRQG